MPRLIRLYIRNVAIGFGLGAVFVALLLGADVAGLRSLILGSPAGWLALFMLVFFNGLLFAGVQFGIAVMRMAEHPDDDPGGAGLRRGADRVRRGLPRLDPEPIPERARHRAVDARPRIARGR